MLASDRYERLLATLEPEWIVVIDTYDAFRAPQDPKTPPRFVPGDGHPSEAGSELIAQTLAAGLRKRRLLGE